jgi:hypothetical protein
MRYQAIENRKNGEQFLHALFMNKEQCERYVLKLNTDHPSKDWTGLPIDWEKIKCFSIEAVEKHPLID